ncbi:TSUP family transporter [Rhizobium ruizarguesonis]|uniref:TSUP family transporter n=1 Tax=Rhizobium ruizarguesonis TaxID=2081791 RepID=UPI0013BF626E|nr:sulfite exporter TauE/SafE family protein [Rhizobium ruizarguesonis]NEJ02580.1 TSUP family transporter [Rhizobium ruizarguesonis]NEJ39708.1 TSUP family transporter [Rhizobium ruizarguesonis]
MSTAGLAGLLVLAGLAAYMQTLTGFALGLIMMGGIGLSGVMPLPEAAVLVGCMVLVNAAQVLARGWRDIAWAEFWPVVISSLAALAAGYWLLGVMVSASIDWLKLVLGVVIIASSLQLALKPQPLVARSSSASFAFFGAIAGLMGGLFSTAGPPLVYHLYRQPLPAVSIRETLVAVFAINAVIRLAMVAAAGEVPHSGFWWGLLCIPVVMIMTFAAKRWPPSLSALSIRRMAFGLLLLSGLSLAVPALLKIIGDHAS